MLISNQMMLGNVKYGLKYEIKLGIEPIRWYGTKTYSERFDRGPDYGFEIYNSWKKYSIGFGVEAKQKLPQNYIVGDRDRLNAYYLLFKQNNRFYSLIGRIGGTAQSKFDPSYYAGIGIEKSFGNLNVQLLGETTRLKNDFNNKQYSSVGIKIGYVFGGSYKIEKNEIEGIKDKILTSGYEAYHTNVSVNDKVELDNFVKKINENNLAGILELRGYSDKSGSKKLNIKIAQDRMDNVEKYLLANNLSEKVKIIKINPEETVKKNYVNDNATPESRKENRRVEVTLILQRKGNR